MHRVTEEDKLNKNSQSHLSLADAPIFKEAETVMNQSEISAAYTVDLRKLTFNKDKKPILTEAIETLKNLHGILIRFENFRM